MLTESEAIKRATEIWVTTFNAIPRDMIRCVVNFDPNKWKEIDSSGDKFNCFEELPMWGIMWSMGDSLDDQWLDTDEGMNAILKCGFRVFEHEDFGYFFGIDSAGYDFYKEHWIPLYKARGLKWHEKFLQEE